MKRIKWAVVSLSAAVYSMAVIFAADEVKPAAQAPKLENAQQNTPADQAWEALKKALIPPAQPVEWRATPPTKEQMADFEKTNGIAAGLAADLARDFYTKFPTHPKAGEARGLESRLLMVAIELGATNRQAQLDGLIEKRLNDPATSEDEKFGIRAKRVVDMLEEEAEDRAALMAKAEKSARDLQSDFPKKEESYDLLLMIARSYLEAENLPKAHEITEEVVKKASGETKEQAESQIRKLDRIGKPLDLNYTDINGKEVNLKAYTGKVILVDFWATWCGPCVAALPELKEIYRKYHDKGFEVLGISLDKEKDTLQKFLDDEKMTWPQHFDGTGWENNFVKKYEIEGIPTMWLIDKKGNLRDLAGRRDLPRKVEKLLAEK